jgi:hypothetical protein
MNDERIFFIRKRKKHKDITLTADYVSVDKIIFNILYHYIIKMQENLLQYNL